MTTAIQMADDAAARVTTSQRGLFEEIAPGSQWDFLVERMAGQYAVAYLLLVLYSIDPDAADRAAADLALAWDAGDSLGEWAHQWREEIKQGKPPTLPGPALRSVGEAS